MDQTFQQSILYWYGVGISDGDVERFFEPLSTMCAPINDERWTPTQWMYFMQTRPVAENMRLAVMALCWRIASQWKDIDSAYALSWLSLWENLHHVRAEYSKKSGCQEYATLTKFDFYPVHTSEQINAWIDCLADTAKKEDPDNTNIELLMPFMAYYPWLDAIAKATSPAFERIENAFVCTFHDAQPSTFYAQHQWLVWCFRHRHPDVAYNSNSVIYRLLSEHSFAQVACFWNKGKDANFDGLQLQEIPTLWQQPLFSGTDIADDDSSYFSSAWMTSIFTPGWPHCLSFWVTMVRFRHRNESPHWLGKIIQMYPAEWKFFDTMYNWMSQISPCMQFSLDSSSADIDMEYAFARTLWTMSRNEKTVDMLPLPNFDD